MIETFARSTHCGDLPRWIAATRESESEMEGEMFSRLWRSWTTAADADRYERLLPADVVPVIDRAAGCRGVYVLRRDVDRGVEFGLMALYDSISQAVHACAGGYNEIALVPPIAKKLLLDADAISTHYEAVVAPV